MVGIGIESSAALGSDPPPLAHQQNTAEQVGPNLHPVKPFFIQLGADTDKKSPPCRQITPLRFLRALLV
jgi:hypothetical protein